MKVFIASDHAGFPLKAYLKEQLQRHYTIQDFGTHSPDSCDYPDYVHPLVCAMEKEDGVVGILICGSGNGVCMTANKYPFIRAALAWDVELARLARAHNDANVLCLPARFISKETALKCVETFLNTPFEGGRHLRRIKKISAMLCN